MSIATLDYSLIKSLNQIEKYVGGTPLYPLSKIFQKEGVELYAKLEWQQLGGSVKARPAFNIIKEAIHNEQLNSNIHLLDATSGNTGIAYATFGAALGIPVTLCIPENASIERKRILTGLGVNIIYTSPLESTDGSQKRAKELKEANPGQYYYADQYSNQHNWQAHYKTTAEEIIFQTAGRVTHFASSLGTTGTFMGVGRKLKEYNEEIQLVSLQPDNPMHGLEGWKHLETAIIPKIYDHSLADSNREIDTELAFEMIKEVARKEGLLISPSAAANLLGAIQVAKSIDRGVVVTVFPDNAEKYGEVLAEIFKD